MQNRGTLVGATLHTNDSADGYPVAEQNEIQGGFHTRNSTTERDAIPAHLRVAGMMCYVIADGHVYQLDNNLITWHDKGSAAGGGSTDPGSGGDSTTVQLISGNFGEWTDLTDPTEYFYANDDGLKFKADLLAFPTRAIVYLRGQFGILNTFNGTELVLGTLPANNRPKFQLKRWMTVQNTELFFVVETTGEVKLISKTSDDMPDGFPLPTGDAGTPPYEPYYVECIFCPDIAPYNPEVFTAHREGDFVRNNCGAGYAGSSVHFAKDYTSTVDQATADDIADANFNNDGQAYANDPANGATCDLLPAVQLSVSYEASGEDDNDAYFDLSAAIVDDLHVAYHYSYNNGSSLVSGNSHLTIPAGEIHWHVFGAAGTEFQVTITSISPTVTSDGKNINY